MQAFGIVIEKICQTQPVMSSWDEFGDEAPVEDPVIKVVLSFLVRECGIDINTPFVISRGGMPEDPSGCGFGFAPPPNDHSLELQVHTTALSYALYLTLRIWNIMKFSRECVSMLLALGTDPNAPVVLE